jgi:hypothetical protein
MADINVKDLFDRDIPGADLFDDSENFMVEISDENEQVIGGIQPANCQPATRGSKWG